jgi:hypothetical protein
MRTVYADTTGYMRDGGGVIMKLQKTKKKERTSGQKIISLVVVCVF